MPKICGIYSITSPSGSFYIGSSIDVYSRWTGHKSDLRNKRHHCQPLQRAADKYGLDALHFTLLGVCSPEEAREVEQATIDIFKPQYNSSQSTFEALSGLWRNPAFRAANIARAGAQIRSLHQNPEFRARQRAGAGKALTELHTNPEFKLRHVERSISRLAVINSTPELRAKAAAARNATYAASPEKQASRIALGKQMMAKLRANPAVMKAVNEGSRDRLKALRADPEARKRNAEAVRKAHSPAVIRINHDGTETEFATAVDAAEASGVGAKGIHRAAKGERKSAGKYRWRYP